jgi:hypothetical protein
MAVAGPGQLNLDEFPSWGSRGVDCFEKLEQIGEGTYGLVPYLSPSQQQFVDLESDSLVPAAGRRQAGLHGEGDGDERDRRPQEDPHGQRARRRKFLCSPFQFPPLSRISVRSSLISSAGAVPDHRHTGDQDPQEAPPPERYPAQGDRHLPRYSKLTMLTWN